MNERYEVSYDRFSRRPPEAALFPGETAPPAGAGQNRGAAIQSSRWAGRARQFRFVARLTAACIVLLALAFFAPVAPAASFANSAQVSVGVVVQFGPPALPYYAQPPCPGEGYIWTPGYWAWAPAYGYYWVPGTWVRAPFAGALWTPGYWAWSDADDGYLWYPGYWGPVVGFYGDIDYGYGYTGYGYQGGYWNQGVFYYNRAVTRVNVTDIRNVYYKRPDIRNHSRVSYDGGSGGIRARPDHAQLAAERERREGPVREQRVQRDYARRDPRERASRNHGAPPIAATPRAGRFRARGVVHASRAGAPYHPVRPNRGSRRGEHRRSYTPARHGAVPHHNRRSARPATRGRPHRTVEPHRNAHPRRRARPQPSRRAGPPQRRGRPHPQHRRARSRPGKPHRPCCSRH